MITTIFYLLTFLFLYKEWKALRHPNQYLAYIKSTNAKLESIEHKEDKKELQAEISSKLTKTDQYDTLVITFYAVWTFIGLLTFNWPFFAGIIILSLIFKERDTKFWNIVDAIVTILLLLGILINKYFIHYQFTVVIREYVMSFLS